ncbi:MAG: hypothetical protein DHS80DRAFT_29457 [Piptocephalis tieghemiana]|nr:MAG: hypothetical protein DHS80DRAFT_29457 [Piptocephalis tieghemiana]
MPSLSPPKPPVTDDSSMPMAYGFERGRSLSFQAPCKPRRPSRGRKPTLATCPSSPVPSAPRKPPVPVRTLTPIVQVTSSSSSSCFPPATVPPSFLDPSHPSLHLVAQPFSSSSFPSSPARPPRVLHRRHRLAMAAPYMLFRKQKLHSKLSSPNSLERRGQMDPPLHSIWTMVLKSIA